MPFPELAGLWKTGGKEGNCHFLSAYYSVTDTPCGQLVQITIFEHLLDAQLGKHSMYIPSCHHLAKKPSHASSLCPSHDPVVSPLTGEKTAVMTDLVTFPRSRAALNLGLCFHISNLRRRKRPRPGLASENGGSKASVSRAKTGTLGGLARLPKFQD